MFKKIFPVFLVSIFAPLSVNAQEAQATGADVGAAYAILGILLVGIVLALLIVFFVSPKAFPRKEFMGAVWPLVKKYFWIFVGILFIQQILINLPSIITGVLQFVYKIPEDEPISSSLNFIVTTAISIMLQAGLVAIALKTIAGGTPAIADLFSQTRVFLRYLGASILYGLIVFGGFLLLIFPGVMWFLKFSLWPYFLVDQNVGVIESLKMSARATKGYKPSLLVFYIYLGALNLLGVAALFLGLFVTAPITLLAIAWVYRRLSAASSVQPVSGTA
ncbi:MAG: hypothetical protein AAB855_03695 [Patescibacteria group bacterium]